MQSGKRVPDWRAVDEAAVAWLTTAAASSAADDELSLKELAGGRHCPQ
jgi:hypothetical protein